MADDKDTKRDPLAWIKQKAAEVTATAEQKAAETPVQMFLPGFDVGAFPNHLNRSSFIAPIARGVRKFHRQTEMVTRKDCVLEYTGEQLDEADGDLIMALIAFAQPFPLGTPVPLNRKELLRKIDALISGRFYGHAEERTGKSGSTFVTCKVRVTSGDGESMFCNVIAFDNGVRKSLLALGDGDSVAVSGVLTVKVWTDKQGTTHPSINLIAHAVLTSYHVTRKRKAMQDEPKQVNPPQDDSPNDCLDDDAL